MSGPIVVEKHIKAPADVVYRYLTESDRWERWQGIGATVDAVPGGFFTVEMANGMRSRGQFIELIENKRVVFTWGWIDHPGLPPGSSTIEVDLVADDAGTTLTLTHRDLPVSEVEMHTMGWNHYVPRLASAAEGNDPGPDPGLG